MPKRQNLSIYQGGSFEFDFDPLLDDAGDPIDLTSGYTAKMQIKENVLDDFIFAEFLDGDGLTLKSDGVITLNISDVDTLTYTWDSAIYDIRLTDPNEVEYSYFGTVEVIRSVTRDSGLFSPIITLPGQPKLITHVTAAENLVEGNIVAIDASGQAALASATGLTDPIGISAGSFSTGETADIYLFHGTIAPILMDSAPAASQQGDAIWLSNTSGTGSMNAPGTGEQIEVAILLEADGVDTTPDSIFLGTGGGGGGGGTTEDFSDLAARDSGDPNLVYAGWKANTGTQTSDPEWKISRLEVSSGTTLFADGDQLYDNVWDNRESLTYS